MLTNETTNITEPAHHKEGEEDSTDASNYLQLIIISSEKHNTQQPRIKCML